MFSSFYHLVLVFANYFWCILSGYNGSLAVATAQLFYFFLLLFLPIHANASIVAQIIAVINTAVMFMFPILSPSFCCPVRYDDR